MFNDDDGEGDDDDIKYLYRVNTCVVKTIVSVGPVQKNKQKLARIPLKM